MVCGVIIRKGEKYYSYLRKLFSAMGDMQLNYKWLLSNYECYPVDASIQKLLKAGYCILGGDQLTELVNTEDFQWIWGTFSAFDPSVDNAEILQYPLPENDMCEDLWKAPLIMQHPLSKIEIVAFDSSSTLIFTRDFSLLETLREVYPQAEDLETLNNDNSLW